MKLFLIGCGCGEAALTREAEEAIRHSTLLIGSSRLLEQFGNGRACVEAVKPEKISSILKECSCKTVSVLFSGDSGFYSGAALLLPFPEGDDITLLPGISSVQAFSAKLGRPWQDWRLCSAHGRRCDAVGEVCREKPVFFLTGGESTPDVLCRQLCEAGLSGLSVAIGENLGMTDERIHRGTAKDYVNCTFSPLSVMIAEKAPGRVQRLPGIPDDCFSRLPGIPMTKREVRAMVLSLLSPSENSVCWDIGSGTGSVAIELALHAGAVYGIDQKEEAVSLAEENRRAFGAWNLRLIRGHAPEALNSLPEADAVFIGGTEGKIAAILHTVRERSPHASVCMSAVTLETLSQAKDALEAYGYAPEILQLSVTRCRPAGRSHMMTAQNPVWLLAGKAP